jgi:hypothetical protein
LKGKTIALLKSCGGYVGFITDITSGRTASYLSNAGVVAGIDSAGSGEHHNIAYDLTRLDAIRPLS